MYCPECGLEQPVEHRFCAACGTRVPRELLARRAPKVSRWFWSMPVTPGDPESAALRASRYLDEVEVTTPEGSVRLPSGHVRFSVWVDDHATCALSIPDHEATRLAEFLLAAVPGVGAEAELTSPGGGAAGSGGGRTARP